MTMKSAARTAIDRRWSRGACAAALWFSIAAGAPAFAQSFEPQDSSENIADSEIVVGDERASEHVDDLLASMENLRTSIERVKIITNMERIDVVYLSDMIDSAPPALEEALEENTDNIRELQRGLEASAIFYNALMTQDVNIPDVVSIELDEPDATIFVRGVAPDQGIAIEDAAPLEDETPAEAEAGAPDENDAGDDAEDDAAPGAPADETVPAPEETPAE